MKDKIEEILKDASKLPPMSNVVTKVLALLQDPAVSITQLASEISKDPVITASIIKLSNSAYYRASKPIRTVQESLMTLGIQTVKEMILVSASKAVLHKDLKGYALEAEEVWTHSLIVALLSGQISTHKKLGMTKDLAFTAGLLHDIGKVILAQFFPYHILDIRNELKNMNTTFTELERKYFGYDHQEVGLQVLTSWNFPEELKEVVGCHHNPERAEKFPILASVVHIANTIAIISGIGIDIGGINHELSSFALKQTGVTDSDLEQYYMEIPDLQKQIIDLKNS
jgi:putative nucleotidyltransferase with HDIG domain